MLKVINWPCKIYTCVVKVVTHTLILGNVLVAFLRNRAAESRDILDVDSN